MNPADNHRQSPASRGHHGDLSDHQASPPQPRIHRAYKACNKCRSRKTRCDITAEEYLAGLPCARCRREMRVCTFPAERHGPNSSQRQKQRTRNTDQNGSHDAETPGRRSDSTNGLVDASEAAQDARNSVVSSRTGLSTGAQPSATQTLPTEITESMMRTAVSNGNEAMNLLFEAARHGVNDAVTNQSVVSTEQGGPSTTSPMQDATASAIPQTVSSATRADLQDARVDERSANLSTQPSAETLDTWNAYRFVRMGWFSAEEAVMYVDLFFQNLAPFSPILDDFYSHHANHYYLVVREPMLCCVILTISSRYHILPVPGGESRAPLIHQRLWDHFQHLLMRIMLGQEKGSKAKTRTLGSVEALLLLTEWQPRGLHVPPAGDGWDSTVLFTMKDARDRSEPDVESPSRGRWLEDVINPARRFDRMAWMAIGAAMSLANELGVFDNDDPLQDHLAELSHYEGRKYRRRTSLSNLLYTYQEQLAIRLGRKSMMPQGFVQGANLSNTAETTEQGYGQNWSWFMTAWTELTKLARCISDMLFPSTAITKHLLRSGRYSGMIEQFMSLLTSWETKYLHDHNKSTYFFDILSVEYNHVKTYANSLGLQAVVERGLAEPHATFAAQNPLELSSEDHTLVSVVVDSCLEILKLATKLHDKGTLRYAPVSMFLRITTSSVFLLKGLGLGVNETKLRDALNILTASVAALRNSKPDDLHLGSRYATLLELHVVRLQENFIPAVRPPRFAMTRPASVERQANTEQDTSDWNLNFGSRLGGGGRALQFGGEASDQLDESWLTLPFDASLLPFAPDEFQDFQGLGDTSMDFIWNLGL